MSLGNGFSFKLKKSSKTEIKTSGLASLSDKQRNEEDDKEFIQSSDNVGKKKKKCDKPELVIPCIANAIGHLAAISGGSGNEDKITDEPEVKKEEVEELSLESRAVKEILESAAQENENWENRGQSKNANLSIAASGNLPKNDEFINNGAEGSKQEDYENVPVEDYGLAMLRGMGWKPGKGIGKNNKVFETTEPVARPKGLGLGATPTNTQSKNGKKEGEKPLVMCKDAYVLVLKGPLRDLYGVVEGMDEISARVFVKMALSNKTESLSENVVKLVSKKEYKENSKCINKNMYDKYKEKQNERKKNWENDKYKNKKSRSRSRSPIIVRKNLARRNLRVRYINDKYKKGKYYNTKMVIEDVLGLDNVVCRSEEDDSIIEGIDPRDLETLIPKHENGVVMILTGREKGHLGTLIKKDKKKCLATIQLLDKREDVFEYDYDDVCEYKRDDLQDYY